MTQEVKDSRLPAEIKIGRSCFNLRFLIYPFQVLLRFLGKGQMFFQIFFILIFTQLDGLDGSCIGNYNGTKMNENKVSFVMYFNLRQL